MLTVNFLVFLFRRGADGQRAPANNRRLSADELSVYAAMVTVWVIGFALPHVSPAANGDKRWYNHGRCHAWSLGRCLSASCCLR
jgi:hypothetical protein